MPDVCADCRGTKEVEVESGYFGKSYYCRKSGKFIMDWFGRGDWHMMQCPCVGEEEFHAETNDK